MEAEKNYQALVEYNGDNESEMYNSLNEDYQKVKSYLFLLRARDEDQKDIAKRFFEKERSKEYLYKCLNEIVDNLEEKDELKLTVLQMLNRFYGVTTKYYKKKQEEQECLMQVEDQTVTSNEQLININQLVDALPYLDAPCEDPRMKEEAKRLLKEEMSKSKKSFEDYLNCIPQREQNYSQTIKDELARVEKQQKMNFTINSIQTHFDQPAPNKVHDWDSWQIIMKKVNMSLSHFQIKNFNLDLLVKFGPQLWKKYLSSYDMILKQLEKETEELQADCETINKERKLKQIEFGEILGDGLSKLNYKISQKFELEAEILKMKYKIKKIMKYKRTKLNRIKKNPISQ